MSKTPRSLSGKVAVVTGGARGIGQALARALAREGVVVAIGDLDAGAAEAAAAELGNGSIGLRARRHRPPRLHRLPRRGRAAPRPARHHGQQRRDHDGHAARLRERREHHPPARDQPARRHPRHAGGDAPHAPARHRPHRQHRLARRHAPPRRASRPTARPSTASSASPRPSAPSCAAPASRSPSSCPASPRPSWPPASRTCAWSRASRPRRSPTQTIDALKFPRFDVWAPKRLAAIIWLGAVMPRKWREAVSRAMNSNRVVATDPRARAAYEARAAASAPAADEVLEEARPRGPGSMEGGEGGSDRV